MIQLFRSFIISLAGIFLLLLLLPINLLLSQEDAKGSSDHPMISRYEGFYIGKMEEVEFDAYTLPLGLAKSEKELGEFKLLEGKVTKINYMQRQAPLPSAFQVFKNFEKAFQDRGMEILFSCHQEACGGRGTDMITSMAAQGKMVNDFMRFGTHAYLAARFSKDDKAYHVGVYIRQEKNQSMYEIHVIESDELNTGKVTVADIESSITETGKKAFYGIYFDFGKATITPESEETLQQIASFLKENSDKEFFIVGHTDNVGDYATNLILSEQRAAAVLAALKKLEVNATKLQAVGVGPVAPVNANNSEDNRAKNRRVELVLK